MSYIPIILLLIIHTPIHLSVQCTKTSSPCECVDDEPCTLDCTGEDNCKGSGYTLRCHPNQPCNLLCAGTSACQDATLDANDATDVTIECTTGTDACSSSSTEYNCGSGDCTIQCDASGSCVAIKLNTNSARSFTCTGANCPSHLQSLQYTAPPTYSPSAEVVNCTGTSSPCACQDPDKYCQLLCLVDGDCQGPEYTLQCKSDKACFITCGGTNTCQNVNVDDNGATKVALTCKDGDGVCAGTSTVLHCGSGDCILRCKSTGSCIDMTVHTDSAASFECSGTECPPELIDLHYTASPTDIPTTAQPTTALPTSAPNTTPLPTTVSVDDAPVNKEEDDYVTMIIIIAVCVVGLGAICFVIFCVFRWKKNKDDSDDEEESEGDMETTGARGTIDYNATTNPTEPQRETRYSMSNNPVAQPPTVSMTNYNNQYTQQGPVHQPVQVTQSGPMYPQQLYSKANMMQNAPSQAQYSNANMMQNAPSQQQYSNPNMMQNGPSQQQYSNPNMMQQAPPQQQQQMNSQYANQLQPQQASNMNQFAAQNAQQIVASQVSQLSMNSDGTDVSLYEKQAEYAQQEMKEKEKSTRSILSANTDVSLYETQQRYSQQEQKELGQLDEVQEVDTFASYQGAPEPARRMSDATTATDVSLYETQQQYLQEEMEEINERRSVSKRKSSRV
eukprot:139001_1